MAEVRQRVLVIDDEEDSRRFVMLSLQKAGYDTLESENGQEGLAKLEEEKPDLIILDVLLPGMDGWEVLRRIRTMSSNPKIPVVMLTVKGSQRDKLGGYIMGADFYISKPFAIGVLLEVVSDVLREKQKDSSCQEQ